LKKSLNIDFLRQVVVFCQDSLAVTVSGEMAIRMPPGCCIFTPDDLQQLRGL